MKKIFTRTFAAIVLAAGISTSAQAQTISLSTTSKIDFNKVTEKTKTIQMSRIFYAGYNTICLPFSVSAEDLQNLVGEGVMLEKLAKAENNELTFLDVTSEGIEAGMPYLIYAPARKTVTFRTNDMQLVTTPTTITVGNATMSGKYEPTTASGLYGIPAQQNTDILQSVLVRTEGDKTFLPTRCGITYNNASEIPTIKHVTSLNSETAISRLQATNAKVDIYTVSGTLVKKGINMNDAMNTLSRGIYVVNGQKFMVK